MKYLDPARFGCQLVLYKTGGLPADGEIKKPLVVFVHGFTADGQCFQDHADYVQRSGYESAIFHYDSYVGIQNAATMLSDRLNSCDSAIREHGVVFVGHSMGGLVVRVLIKYHLPKLANYVRGMVLLGTPSDGTLINSRVFRRMLDWGENLSKEFTLNPYTRTALCRSAKELIQSDRQKLLKKLNDEERNKPATVPTCTISGGKRYIELGGVWEFLANRGLQRILGERNDGLVPEASVNLVTVLGNAENRLHWNGYPEYWDINHTALAMNQSIAIKIKDFLRQFAPP